MPHPGAPHPAPPPWVKARGSTPPRWGRVAARPAASAAGAASCTATAAHHASLSYGPGRPSAGEDGEPAPRVPGLRRPGSRGVALSTLQGRARACQVRTPTRPQAVRRDAAPSPGRGRPSLDADLADRVQVYADHLHEPRTDSTFMALPADPRSLQGWDPSLALVDELHVVTDDTFEAISTRAGKRDRSLLLAISTPPKASQDDSVMRRLVDHGREGADPSFFFAEFAAPAGCAVDDEAAWALANPALDDFLHRDALRATLPPKMREAAFRRDRLGQWTAVDDAWLPDGAWARCADPTTSPTPSCGKTRAAPGWPRSTRTHPGASTPRWPRSWPCTGPPTWPAPTSQASTSERATAPGGRRPVDSPGGRNPDRARLWPSPVMRPMVPPSGARLRSTRPPTYRRTPATLPALPAKQANAPVAKGRTNDRGVPPSWRVR
jgi:hypothetical protein